MKHDDDSGSATRAREARETHYADFPSVKKRKKSGGGGRREDMNRKRTLMARRFPKIVRDRLQTRS